MRGTEERCGTPTDTYTLLPCRKPLRGQGRPGRATPGDGALTAAVVAGEGAESGEKSGVYGV